MIAPGPTRRPVRTACLVVLDGWGIAPDGPGNAISLADTPTFDELRATYDHAQLTACGEAVGLPVGQIGNSEVGHLNLGAGAIVPQDLTRIDAAVDDDSLGDSAVLRDAVVDAERVHLIGLVSTGGVHSSHRHLRALIELAADWEVPDLVIHAFTDGRDTPPTSGAHMLDSVEGWCEGFGAGRVASVIGRYYAMDRDQRWERTQQALDLLLHGTAQHTASDAAEALRAAYERGETDEFVTATRIGERDGTIRPGDAVLAFNFRPDRMRQITRALAEPGFAEADRRGAEPVARFVTLTAYDERWPYPVAFGPHRPATTMAAVIAARGLAQLHVAETEKYPHVTYFFNGGEEQPHDGELRELVDSPRDVPTYDRKPEMSAVAATDAFVAHYADDPPAFAIINFANADMVGHTGVLPAAVRAVETVDACLARVVEAVHGAGGACLVTADHGNADRMLERDGSPNTAHSLNPVPAIVTQRGARLRDGGILADVAPTLLELLGIEKPSEMTGTSLLS